MNKAARLYAIKGQEEELLYPLEYFQAMLDEGIETDARALVLEVYEPKTGTGTFFCAELGEGFESGPGQCGKFDCSDYEPRNGKSGRCRWHRTPHWPTDKIITIRKRGTDEISHQPKPRY